MSYIRYRHIYQNCLKFSSPLEVTGVSYTYMIAMFTKYETMFPYPPEETGVSYIMRKFLRFIGFRFPSPLEVIGVSNRNSKL